MTLRKNPLLTAIDIASHSKAILLHVQKNGTFDPMPAQEEFCGTSLFPAQMSIQPMLLALSMEMALKAWIVFDAGKNDVPKDHDLWNLFSYMSVDTQERLKTRYERELAPRHPNVFFSDYGLERVLDDARRAFIQWRYAYELDKARFDHSRFIETIEMMLSEFESRIVVERAPSLSRP